MSQQVSSFIQAIVFSGLARYLRRQIRWPSTFERSAALERLKQLELAAA
jgi:hypothetical protein